MQLMRGSNAKLTNNQQGFAAIVIAMVLILVLSLITVGFATLMRKETRSALDKQLSQQADYAAESGLNAAAKAVSAGYIGEKTDCAPFTNTQANDNTSGGTTSASKAAAKDYLTNNVVGVAGESNVSFPCLLVDPTPDSAEFSSVDTEQPTVVELTAKGETQAINKIVIKWQDANGGASFAGQNDATFPKDWPFTGILRVDLTAIRSGSIDRQRLADNTFSAFLYPNGDPSPPADPAEYAFSSSSGQAGGSILNGHCNAKADSNDPRNCAVAITGLNERTYFLTMRSIYKNTKVSITAFGNSDPSQPLVQLEIKNAQVKVDATGKAEDILKRLSARIPVRNGYDRPAFSLQAAGSICKQLTVRPSDAQRGVGC